MSDYNIVIADFRNRNRVVMTDVIYQYDYGQKLQVQNVPALPQTFEAHFSNIQHCGSSITVAGIDGMVDIPNTLIATGKRIYCWIYVTEPGSGETVYQILMPVQSRPMPEYYDVEDVGVFDSVVNQVAEYAATATTGATSATASATAAAGSATAAAASATNAANSAENAAASEANAEASASAAQASDASAATAATTATTKAAQAAQSATSAGSAAGRAEAAQEAAEAAQEAAETAATSATADAATATAKATAAAASATTASAKATDAINAATTATAQAVAAEAAKTTAVEAKTAAQSAQSAAETAATTATAKATEAAASATAAAQAAASINTPDSALSDTSTNAVQNKVITGEITDVKSAIRFPYAYSDVEQGGFSESGKNVANNNRIRTVGFIPVIEGGTVSVRYDCLLENVVAYCAINFYETNDLTVSRISASEWGLSGAEVEAPSNARYCRVIWKKNAIGTERIAPDALSNIAVEVKASDIIEKVREDVAKINEAFSIAVPVKVGTLNSQGIESENTTIRLINDGFINVVPGQEITITWESDLTLQCAASYYTVADYSTPRVNASSYFVNGAKITVPSEAAYVRFIWRVGSAGSAALPLSSLSNVRLAPMSIPDIIRSVFSPTKSYVRNTVLEQQNIDLSYINDITRQQAFCRYNSKWYSTDGTGITVQSDDFSVESETALALGHGNSMHCGTLHPEYAYVSGWNDQKIYVVDLTTITVVDTINLPTTGYTTAAVDDLNGIAYIFQRDTYPDTNEHYNFIAYDYVNDTVLSQRKTARSFGAMQSCDIWQDKIIAVNGQGKSSGRLNYYIIYDRQGNIMQEVFIPQLESKEPEGVMFDRDSLCVWIGMQIVNGGQQLYKITPHEI